MIASNKAIRPPTSIAGTSGVAGSTSRASGIEIALRESETNKIDTENYRVACAAVGDAIVTLSAVNIMTS